MSDQLYLWPDEAPGDGLRWSVSRDKRLRDCHRKYYLQHYGSRGGWQPSSPPEIRELHVLKSLRNRFMWVGTVVHDMIELALQSWRRGDVVRVEALVERGTRTMRAQYAESLQGVYRERPMQACGLVEHEYREEIEREEWKRQRDKMEQCLRTFFGLSLTRTIRETPPWRWLALESMGSFEHAGATVLVKPDFAWRDPAGHVVMVDWKTGQRRDDDAQQIAVYGSYARRAWGLGTDHLLGHVVYLERGEIQDVRVDLDDLARADASIMESVEQMRALAGEPGEDPPAADFPKTEDVERCRYCVFRRPCGRE